MKQSTKRKTIKALCLVAQASLLVVCATSFAMMSAMSAPAETQSTPTPAAIEEPLPMDMQPELIESEPSDAVPSSAEPQTPQRSTIELYKADQRGSLAARVAQLMQNTSLSHDGAVHYDELLRSATVWRVPYVLIRFDELAYIYFEALKAAAPKAKEARLQSVQATVDGDVLRLDMTVGFVVTNKLIKLMMGSAEQVITARVAVVPVGESVQVRSVSVEGNKKYAESTVKLGSDFLLGTEDYVGFVSDLAAKVTASLGKVRSIDEVRYGVTFACATA